MRMRGVDAVNLHRLAGAALCAAVAACAGGPTRPGAVAPAAHDSAVARTVDSLGAAIAQVAQDSAADQQVLDSLHRPPRADTMRAHPDSAPPALKREEVQPEAERLFGAQGKAAIGVAPLPRTNLHID